MSLVEKIRKAREQVVTVGGHDFTIRRPTELEMVELQAAGRGRGRAILPHVVGWSGVRAIDVLPGGDPHPLEFDARVRDEWLTDRLDLLQPLAEAVFKAFDDHARQQEAAAKN